MEYYPSQESGHHREPSKHGLSFQCPSKEKANFLKCREQDFAKLQLNIIFLGEIVLKTVMKIFPVIVTALSLRDLKMPNGKMDIKLVLQHLAWVKGQRSTP